jgi:TNF receptor-associated factor 4
MLSSDNISLIERPPGSIDIECPICLQVMTDDPHLVVCCGHHFCGPCISKITGPCPLCKQQTFQAVPDKGRSRFINGLQVTCVNKACDWRGELKALSSHLEPGKREGDCRYVMVKCKHEKCPVQMERLKLANHEDNKCPFRPNKCQYCKCVLGAGKKVEEHYGKCGKYPIHCPNECGPDKYPRDAISNHLTKKCPLHPVDCEFKWVGCNDKVLRKDITQHGIDNQSKHMALLVKASTKLKQKNDQLTKEKNNLTKEKQNLTSAKNSIKKENKKLRNEIVNLKEKNDKVVAENEELISENEELTAQNDDLVTENDDLLAKNDKIISDIEELVAENEEIKSENEELKRKDETLTKEVEKLNDDCEVLKENLVDLQIYPNDQSIITTMV